jgi:hypothetical protein
MVVVFVVVARAPTAAVVAEAKFKLNRRAWNMAEIVMDAACGISDSARVGFKPEP